MLFAALVFQLERLVILDVLDQKLKGPAALGGLQRILKDRWRETPAVNSDDLHSRPYAGVKGRHAKNGIQNGSVGIQNKTYRILGIDKLANLFNAPQQL